MAALRPLMKLKTVEKRTKKFSGTSHTDRSKLNVTGGIPEALVTGCTGDSRASIGYGSNRKQSTCWPIGFWKFLVLKVKELEVLLMCNNSFRAEIARNVSSHTRKATMGRATHPGRHGSVVER
ncbi:large ribosomal subunit protein eL32-like [Myotis yumanensis]|uniref:large ribosomal subunit protein eL32-like n=1 Tax=Myotis yumanensis TaxID=159337 RepID=UPI0038CFCE1A